MTAGGGGCQCLPKFRLGDSNSKSNRGTDGFPLAGPNVVHDAPVGLEGRLRQIYRAAFAAERIPLVDPGCEKLIPRIVGILAPGASNFRLLTSANNALREPFSRFAKHLNEFFESETKDRAKKSFLFGWNLKKVGTVATQRPQVVEQNAVSTR
jgi:hypothetical protein